MEVGRCTGAGIGAASVALSCLLAAGGRNRWKTSGFFLSLSLIPPEGKVPDFISVVFYCTGLLAPASHRQAGAVTGAPLCVPSPAGSLVFRAAMNVGNPNGSHFHFYPGFPVSFFPPWKAR